MSFTLYKVTLFWNLSLITDLGTQEWLPRYFPLNLLIIKWYQKFHVWNSRSLKGFQYCYPFFIAEYLWSKPFWIIRHTLYVLNSANLACITHYWLSPSAHTYIYSVHNLKMWDSYYLIHSWMVVSSIFLMLTCNTPFYENLFLGSKFKLW